MKRFARILAICLCLAAISVVAASVVGCGNSTLIKTLNRMNDLVDGCRVTGEVKIVTISPSIWQCFAKTSAWCFNAPIRLR